MTISIMVARNRLAVAIIALGAVALSPGLVRASSESIMYFWEDERTYGWSAIADPRHFDPPPRIFNHKQSLSEQCARMVGRLLRRDRSSGRIHSTQLEDACIRNGGRI